MKADIADGTASGRGWASRHGHGSAPHRIDPADLALGIAAQDRCLDRRCARPPRPGPARRPSATRPLLRFALAEGVRLAADGLVALSITAIAATSKNRSPQALHRVWRNRRTSRPPDNSQSSTTSARALRPHIGQGRDETGTACGWNLRIGRAFGGDEDIEDFLPFDCRELSLRVDRQTIIGEALDHVKRFPPTCSRMSRPNGLGDPAGVDNRPENEIMRQAVGIHLAFRLCREQDLLG